MIDRIKKIVCIALVAVPTAIIFLILMLSIVLTAFPDPGESAISDVLEGRFQGSWELTSHPARSDVPAHIELTVETWDRKLPKGAQAFALPRTEWATGTAVVDDVTYVFELETRSLFPAIQFWKENERRLWEVVADSPIEKPVWAFSRRARYFGPDRLEMTFLPETPEAFVAYYTRVGR